MKTVMYPEIQSTEFGEVMINNLTYKNDMYIEVTGKLKNRNMRLARELFGTAHKVGPEELKILCTKETEIIFIGSGQEGCFEVTNEGKEFLDKEGITCDVQPTPEVIKLYNKSTKRKAALIHVTC